jgi:hypothetical protein
MTIHKMFVHNELRLRIFLSLRAVGQFRSVARNASRYALECYDTILYEFPIGWVLQSCRNVLHVNDLRHKHIATEDSGVGGASADGEGEDQD